MKKSIAIAIVTLILSSVLLLSIMTPAVLATDLMDSATFDTLPSGWTYNDAAKVITVDTFNENQKIFAGVTIDNTKTYEYDFTLNFTEQQSNGSARILFRFNGFTDCQALYVQPNYGLIFGTDYWCSTNFTAPAGQPSIALNTDYAVKIITGPDFVRVYLNGEEKLNKTGVSTSGLQVGLASNLAKFTMSDISLSEYVEVTDPNALALASTPSGWAFNSSTKTIAVTSLSESQAFFSSPVIDGAKTYEYKFKLNFTEQSTSGSARILFRYGSFTDCQALYVQPGFGLLYGTDYWCTTDYTVPATQPTVLLNTNYEIKIVTAPNSVKVYLDGVEKISKSGILSTGIQLGLASFNTKFTMSEISITEVTGSGGTGNIDPDNLLNSVRYTLPSNWSIGDSQQISIDSYDESIVIFKGVTLSATKSYVYKAKINFSQTGTFGSLRIPFRYKSNQKTQAIHIQPGKGILFGTDYWCSSGYTQKEMTIDYNTDYELEIQTHPSGVIVLVDGTEVMRKTGLTIAGNLLGLASYNAKVTISDYSLKEISTPEGFEFIPSNDDSFDFVMPNPSAPENLFNNAGVSLRIPQENSNNPDSWSFTDGVITKVSPAEEYAFIDGLGLEPGDNYLYAGKLKITRDTDIVWGGARIVIRGTDRVKSLVLTFWDGGGDSDFRLFYGMSADEGAANEYVPFDFKEGQEYSFKIYSYTDYVKIYVDGQLIFKKEIPHYDAGVGISAVNTDLEMSDLYLAKIDYAEMDPGNIPVFEDYLSYPNYKADMEPDYENPAAPGANPDTGDEFKVLLLILVLVTGIVAILFNNTKKANGGSDI